MTGTISGKRYRVVGRVVLGEHEAGGTYYWNEYNLETFDGTSATLVFERTEHGGEWRLFHMFEPDFPMTADDAATRRVGDPLNLEGTQVFVNFVSKSHVYHIEGKAPEGVAQGKEAHYFNAITGSKMIVVSWTGEEVEFYKGINLSREVVSSAFNVRISSFTGALSGPGSGCKNSSMILVVGFFLCIFVVLEIGSPLFTRRRRAPAFVHTAAPASPLAIGQRGTLAGKQFQIQSHAVVEISMVDWKFDRHEYLLSAEDGSRYLLVFGSKPGAADWLLLHPVDPTHPPGETSPPQTPATAQQAAAVKWGQTVNLNGTAAKVTELFQSHIRKMESPEASDLNTGDTFYGFTATAPNTQFLVRWNSQYINFFQGKVMPEKDVLTAFARTSAR